MDQYTMTEQAYKNGYNAALKEFAAKLKEHACFYDLDNYHSFSAIDVDNIDDIVKELIKEQAHMADNNLIKALKCCINDNTCGNCPFKSETDNICKYTTVDFYSIILDFINHQQSEIEYLKQENSLLHMLMKDSRQTIKQNDILLTNIESNNFIPEPCRNCTNHPSNGGDGMCNCTLGGTTIYG